MSGLGRRRLDRISGVVLTVTSGLVFTTLPLGAVANAPSGEAPRTPRQIARQVDHRLDLMGARVIGLERIASRWRLWLRCVRPVPVDEVGDAGRDFGFRYDQLDGTGLHHRRGLVVHQGPGRAQFALLAFARRPACWSDPVDPNGTGDDAKSENPAADSKRPRSLVGTVRRLERRVGRLESRIAALSRAANRFDEWESCLSAVGLTEQGDPARRYGYHFQGLTGRAYQHALNVDTTEWDDPDYQFLAFIGRDRPFTRRECSRDPGEAPDKAKSLISGTSYPAKGPRREVVEDLVQVAADSRELAEDIPDLRSDLSEFTSFDECMFTVGVSYLGSTTGRVGYLFEGPRGKVTQRPAMGLALDGALRARWDFLAFPGEEPPQIECNEDAAGQDTEE